MSVVFFDTLKLALRLESAGFSRDQATGAAEALAESLSGDIATKTDLLAAKTDLESSIAKLGADLRTEIAAVRASTAQWIVGAAFVNVVGMLGAVAAVWQLAHK